LSKQYDTAARVYRFATRRYFIRYNANGNPSLYRDDNGAGTTELVEGIESLQILFGVTNSPPSGPPNQYYKANDVNLNWANVVSVRIGILARTPNQQDADVDTRTYDVNGTVLGPFNDRNSRRVFMTTVSLRNRVLP
jgi:type IV pilus assembly protein PilW